ncbi:hypothetical protein FOA52_000101 [Chlamydomonas sp. UWO 241]|nr:hypothetical protein FOA52_000101 [Chlamydomonas sp. UWO 241]
MQPGWGSACMRSNHTRMHAAGSAASPGPPTRPTRPTRPSAPAPQHGLAPGEQDPVERARKRTGYQNKWHRHTVDEAKQTVMAAPMPWSHARVAIIGGGVAGLCTALGLVRAGVRCVVFDTGEHGTGGRLATRAAADGSLRPAWLPRDTPSDLDAGAGLVFDHAAQYFTASDPEFVALVEEWRKAGVVRQWDGPVGVLDAQAAPGADRFTATPLGPKGRWVTAGGMRALAAHMTRTLQEGFPDLFELRAPVWVSRMELQYATPAGATAATPTGATPAAATLAAATTKAAVAVGGAAAWKLLGRGGKSEGSFDAVVIAHNGKCANRLVSPAGAPLVAKQLMALRLSAVWSLMVAFDGPLPFDQSASCAPFQGATVSGCAALGWVADNSAKLRLEHARPGLSCWTLQSTDAYAQANKVPQEQVPPDVQAK